MYKVGKAFLFIYLEIRGNCSNSGRQTVVNMIKTVFTFKPIWKRNQKGIWRIEARARP
jgi:hypothetical protein